MYSVYLPCETLATRAQEHNHKCVQSGVLKIPPTHWTQYFFLPGDDIYPKILSSRQKEDYRALLLCCPTGSNKTTLAFSSLKVAYHCASHCSCNFCTLTLNTHAHNEYVRTSHNDVPTNFQTYVWNVRDVRLNCLNARLGCLNVCLGCLNVRLNCLNVRLRCLNVCPSCTF